MDETPNLFLASITTVIDVVRGVMDYVADSDVLMPIFVACLFYAGCKVFKKIKSSVK